MGVIELVNLLMEVIKVKLNENSELKLNIVFINHFNSLGPISIQLKEN